MQQTANFDDSLVEFKAYAKELLEQYNIEFEDDEGTSILYNEMAQLDELVKSVFSVEISHLTIIEKGDIDGILGGITFVNEYDHKRQCETTEVHNYSCSVEHLIKD